MSSKHAEFVVLSGPQQGQVIAVVGERVVVGRSAECTIALKEDYVSRRQLELERTAQGWLMNNVSSNGTLVNGKRYKAGAKILLDTGDVLGVGLETELLFVNAGSDADEALRAWQDKTKPVSPAKPPEDTAATPPPDAPPVERLPDPVARSTERMAAVEPPPAAVSSTPGPVDPAESAKKAKYKKYTVAASIYFVLMLGVIILAVIYRDSDEGGSDAGQSGLPILTADEIDQAIRARPEVSQDLTRAMQELRDAQGLYSSANVRVGDKYKCIKHYKLYQAYRGSVAFENSLDQQQFDSLIEGTGESRLRGEPDGLVPTVQREYNRAVNLCAQSRWPEALRTLQKLLDIVNEQDPRDPTYQGLVSNINKWRELAQSKVPTKRSGPRM